MQKPIFMFAGALVASAIILIPEQLRANDIVVSGQIFSGSGKDGDFSWMIGQEKCRDVLFVFNDKSIQSASG
jgi:hypothetical protein